MRNWIKRAVMMGFLIAASVGVGACLPPPGEACGDGWCPAGYRCAQVDPTTTTCLESTCGDGEVNAGEECDDGNLADTDDCLWTCQHNTCGDGVVNPRTEACDDGNGEDGDDCDSNCTATACGNGVLTAGERCEDGNRNDGDGCDDDCAVSLHGYIKASNTGAQDWFGNSIALSADGSTLAVGAWREDSAALGIGGDGADAAALDSGAVYISIRCTDRVLVRRAA